MDLSEVTQKKLERGWRRKIPHYLLEYRHVPLVVVNIPYLVVAVRLKYSEKRLQQVIRSVELASVPVGGFLYLDFYYVTECGEFIVTGIRSGKHPCFSKKVRNHLLATVDLLVDQLMMHVDTFI